MLIVTIGPTASRPEVLFELAGAQPCVAVLLPGAALSRHTVDRITERCYVIEYLAPPHSASAIITQVFARLGHLLADSSAPLVFIDHAASANEIEARIKLAESRDSEITIVDGRDGNTVEIVIGKTIMKNPLLLRFFALMSEAGIGDQRGLALLRETFGGTSA